MILIKNKNFIAFMVSSSSCAGIFFTMVGFISFEYSRIGATASEIGFWFIKSLWLHIGKLYNKALR